MREGYIIAATILHTCNNVTLLYFTVGVAHKYGTLKIHRWLHYALPCYVHLICLAHISIIWIISYKEKKITPKNQKKIILFFFSLI